MNKSDIKLIVIISFISIFLLLIINLTKKDSNKALVYYNDKVIKEIDLNIDGNYEVEGYNGKVIIEVKNNKIRVVEENSEKKLCSKQGYISESYESIVCLPNKIVITISSSNEIDTIIR